MDDGSSEKENSREATGAKLTPRRRPWLGGRAFDLMLGLGVMLVSVVSLFVAVSSNRTQERMLAASVWPSMQFGTSNVSTEGEPQITFDLLNRGVGPARIRWAEVSYDGIPVRTYGEFLRRCCGFEGESPGFSSGLQHRVLSSDEWVKVVQIPKQSVTEQLWQALDQARKKVRLRTCYCSVLDDCWMLDSDVEDVEAVRECPPAPAVVWGR